MLVKNLRKTSTLFVVSTGLVLLTTTACSPQFQTVEVSAKRQVLSTNLFAASYYASQTPQNLPSNNTALPTLTNTSAVLPDTNVVKAPEEPVTPVVPEVPMTTTIQTSLVCSDEGTEIAGTNLRSLVGYGGGLNLVVTNQIKASAFEDNEGYNDGLKRCVVSAPATIATDIINTKSFSVDLNACQLDANTVYTFFLVDKTKSAAQLTQGQGVLAVWNARGGSPSSALDQQEVYTNDDAKRTPWVLTGTGDEEESCDASDSPLAILLASEGPAKITLSSLTEGIFFDLLGAKNNHQPVQISWLTQRNLYFLVKANRSGKVEGIDELFGNNTAGPDGKFAKTGYHALAKFDGKDVTGTKQLRRADGFITAQDPVFNELGLWNDSNRDGIAQVSEIVGLRAKGIAVIDLNYDRNYREVDTYGNQILMKSVVKTNRGELLPIFDIWFRHLK